MKLADITPEMLVYLAAPYSAPTKEQIEARMGLFCQMDADLIAQGINTVSPVSKHFILEYRDLPGNWAYWGKYSELLLNRCDAMVVLCLDGWYESTGVRAEIEIAKAKGIPIIYLNEDGTER